MGLSQRVGAAGAHAGGGSRRVWRRRRRGLGAERCAEGGGGQLQLADVNGVHARKVRRAVASGAERGAAVSTRRSGRSGGLTVGDVQVEKTHSLKAPAFNH